MYVSLLCCAGIYVVNTAEFLPKNFKKYLKFFVLFMAAYDFKAIFFGFFMGGQHLVCDEYCGLLPNLYFCPPLKKTPLLELKKSAIFSITSVRHTLKNHQNGQKVGKK